MKRIGLAEYLKNNVLLLDGATGTMLRTLDENALDFGGGQFSMLNDILNFSRPQEIKALHRRYLEAGANAIEANTFASCPMRLNEYDFTKLDTSGFAGDTGGITLAKLDGSELSYHLSRRGAELAVESVREYSSSKEYSGRPLFVFGSAGPSNYVLSPTEAELRKSTWEKIEDNFRIQVLGLIDGGVDAILFETQQDMLEVKAALSGAFKAFSEKNRHLPVIAQVTADKFARMQIFHTDVAAAAVTLQDTGIDVFGINCSIGPDLMEEAVKKITGVCRLPVSVVPNAGMPSSENGNTVYKLKPAEMTKHMMKFVKEYGVNIVGGCCGTTPEHIKALSEALGDRKLSKKKKDKGLFISGPQEAIPLDSRNGLIRIGERLNVRGSKKVREAVENNPSKIDYAALAEVASQQTDTLGLGIIDVCMDSNAADTKELLPDVIRHLCADFPAAMSLDSFDANALGEAVNVYPGRPIINSISLEKTDGGSSRLEDVIKKTAFHAPVYIALVADDSGPAKTADEKAALAEKIIKRCGELGVPPERILIDINAFPIGSETDGKINFALESLKSIPLIKALHPDVKTTIGAGNLTNGLSSKPYMRKVITSVFLAEARKRGLDAAIVNPNHYTPADSLPEDDLKLGRAVVLEHDMEAFAKLEEIALAKKGLSKPSSGNYADLPAAERTCEKIKDGYRAREEVVIELTGKDGKKKKFTYGDRIVFDARDAVEAGNLKPVDFINTYLMPAMEDTGKKFETGELSLPRLLKSADLMKQTMDFLEDCMELSGGGRSAADGSIVLGTVWQDVHSIGKDLVRTLLENYGWKVTDLGVQVKSESFVAEAEKTKAAAIGMSALLVQTSARMLDVARLVREKGLDIPLLIGGACVNLKHAAAVAEAGRGPGQKIKKDVFYCPSAMDAANVLNSLGSKKREDFIEKNARKLIEVLEKDKALKPRLSRRKVSLEKYSPPEVKFGIRIFEMPLKELDINIRSLKYINWKLNNDDEAEVRKKADEWIENASENGWIKPRGIGGFFPCGSEGDNLVLFDPDKPDVRIAEFDFSIRTSPDRKEKFSAAQYFLPLSSGRKDVAGLQIASSGIETDEAVKIFLDRKDTEAAMLLRGLANRCAEDLANFIHSELRKSAGIPPRAGGRLSPGYPAIRNMENNKSIFRILGAGKLGVRMTEAGGFYPLATTAAIVCFNPDLKY